MKKLICLCLIMISCFAFSSVLASNTFYDTRGTKYEGVVERMVKLEIVNGLSRTTFAPNKSVTRAELAKIIVKMKGIDDYAEDMQYKKIFSDVNEDDWFSPYVMAAADLELINGYEDGTFKPNQEVSYAEMVVIMLRYLGYNRISQDSPNGWYWNYIVKMREIELNDNVGEFDYTAPAKRGDVAMFAWNALITNRWAISLESEKDGFTYTYSEESPLEIYFDDYSFIDNKEVSALGGFDGKPAVIVNGNYYTTTEKVPLYVLGGKVTALYNKESGELMGVTFDEDYEDAVIVSGPIFYLKDEGYQFSRAKKVAYYGSKDEASYAYLVMNKEKTEILRAVYLDASNSILVNSISLKTESGDDDEEIQIIKLNDNELSSETTTLVKDGFLIEWSELQKDDVLTDLGNGLYIYSSAQITEQITNFNKKNEIWLDEDKYIISDACVYYTYNDSDAKKYGTLTSSKVKEYIGIEATAYLNVAEEVCKIEFGKTIKENEKFLFGYVTKVRNYSDESVHVIDVSYDNGKTKTYKVTGGNNEFIEKGDFVAVNESEKGGYECTILENDKAFDNDISVKYNYDYKEISYPMVGEYILTENTKYYKVTLRYENNSVTKIDECNVEEFYLEDVTDLMAYKINLVYDENMEVLKVYAVSEENKYDTRVALVKDIKIIKKDTEDETKYTYRITLSITESYIMVYEMEAEEASKYRIGDIVSFNIDEDSDDDIIFNESFKHEFIGYKRDLIVQSFNENTKKILFNDGNVMDLNRDVYDWNGYKINLNAYRFIIADVEKDASEWNFNYLRMVDKKDVAVNEGDRIAIGEINDVIVIYRGYEE